MGEAKVDTPCEAHKVMSRSWELLDALAGGTRAMREAGATWLPLESKEEPDAHARRLQRSFLKPAYRDGRDRLSARPFAKVVTIKGELPNVLKPLANNVDGRGSNLTTFAQAFLREALHRGVVHSLVELPKNPDRLVPADPRAPRLLPYFRCITAKDMIGWRFDGALSQIRFRNKRMDNDGEWGEKKVDEIRVYEPKKTRLFESSEDKTDFAERTEAAAEVTIGKVPLVTLNLSDPGSMIAEPPLESLAWLNLAHWQSLSDQRNCLRFARLAMLFFSGIRKEEADKIVPGPAGIFYSENTDAKGGFIEHGGKAMEIGRLDLQDLEAAMAILALEPMLQQTGNPTATARALDEANVQSNLLAWVRLLEQSLEEMFRYAAEWMNVSLPTDFSVDVFDNFGLTIRAEWEIQRLLDARGKKAITVKTLLQELKLRGLLSEGLDVTKELEELADEGPDLSTLGSLFGGPRPNPTAAGAA